MDRSDAQRDRARLKRAKMLRERVERGKRGALEMHAEAHRVQGCRGAGRAWISNRSMCVYGCSFNF